MTTAFDDAPDLDLSGLQIEEDVPSPKRTRRPRSDAGVPRGRMSTGMLAEQLLAPWATLTLVVSQPLPLVGAVMADRGEATTKAIVELSKGHPKMLAALKKAAKAGPGSEVAQTAAMIGIALAIELGRIAPDSSIAQKTGMSEVYYALHPDQAPEQSPDTNTTFPFSAPPGMPA